MTLNIKGNTLMSPITVIKFTPHFLGIFMDLFQNW
jgi:hypothetical protein